MPIFSAVNCSPLGVFAIAAIKAFSSAIAVAEGVKPFKAPPS
nr:MAG TPA: hypothetical protein [Caudoviricetes sp.]